jgi:hypothetical protein
LARAILDILLPFNNWNPYYILLCETSMGLKFNNLQEGFPNVFEISKWDPAQMKERCCLPWKNMG